MQLIIRFLLVVSCLCGSVYAHASEYSILKITKKDKSFYLIGSFHVGKEEIKKNDALNFILENSEAICLEYDPNNVDSIRRNQEKILFNPVNIKLRDRLGSDLYEKVVTRISSAKKPIRHIDILTPFAVATSLLNTAPEIQEISVNYQVKNSLDSYIKNFAKEKNIPIRAIEDEDALAIEMLKITDAEWAQYIYGVFNILDCTDCIKKYAENIKIAYQGSSDFEHAYRHNIMAISDSAQMEKVVDKVLLVERNIKIVKNIETQVFQGNKCNVVAVGAAHLGGENGLVKLLKEKDFIIEVK